MQLAIHHRPGSFSDRWIAYCEKKSIPYKLVNAFDSDIVQQLSDCDAFMWHHHHAVYKDVVAAKRILFALEHAGIKVFPDFKTGWHFDDKVAQKYLLEAIGAPLVPSYVFYDKQEALAWAKATSYPKVFKLKGGAGASNVRLVNDEKSAIELINKAFSKGFSQFDSLGYLRERVYRYKTGKDNFFGLAKGVLRLIKKPKFASQQTNERGYIYFQKFIPNNSSDTRIVVINGRYAAAEKRMVRAGDFRASGSGNYSYDNISKEALSCAFNVAQRLNLAAVAFDFVEDESGNPLIVELSYGFGTAGISNAPGFWDQDLNWYEEKFISEYLILYGVVNGIG